MDTSGVKEARFSTRNSSKMIETMANSIFTLDIVQINSA